MEEEFKKNSQVYRKITVVDRFEKICHYVPLCDGNICRAAEFSRLPRSLARLNVVSRVTAEEIFFSCGSLSTGRLRPGLDESSAEIYNSTIVGALIKLFITMNRLKLPGTVETAAKSSPPLIPKLISQICNQLNYSARFDFFCSIPDSIYVKQRLCEELQLV